MKFICPLIVVDDIQKSKAFYENVLNQKVKYDFGENISFEGDFAIHQKQHYLKLLECSNINVTKKSNSFELYFESDEIDKMYKKLVESKVEFLHKIEEQPWGQKVLRFYDSDGHIIEIGESMEAVVTRFHKQGFSTDEIVQKSSMPIEFVQQVLASK